MDGSIQRPALVSLCGIVRLSGFAACYGCRRGPRDSRALAVVEAETEQQSRVLNSLVCVSGCDIARENRRRRRREMIRVASPRPPSAVQLRRCGGACPFWARGYGSRVAATSGSRRSRKRGAISCCSSDDREVARGAAPPAPAPTAPSDGSIQLYSQIEK